MRYVFVDLVGSLLHFPFWWYTTGFLGVVRYFGQSLAYRWRSYNFRIWMKNFFVPMYGQYDWTGRLVSVALRFFVLLGRFIAYLIEAVLYFFLMIVWLVAPPAFLLLFFYSLSLYGYGK